MKVEQIKKYLESISMENEVWEQFKASESSMDDYILWFVSTKGRIAKNYKVSFGKLHPDGYRYLGNMKAIHRIVAEAFIKKTDIDIKLGRNYIDHIDGNKSNNSVDNLRWCTIKENNNFELAKSRRKRFKSGVLNPSRINGPSNKSKKLYNNGNICHYYEKGKEPAGYVLGRLKGRG